MRGGVGMPGVGLAVEIEGVGPLHRVAPRDSGALDDIGCGIRYRRPGELSRLIPGGGGDRLLR